VIDVIILMVLVSFFGRPGAEADDPVEAPKWKPITMVTIGIVCFALLVRARRPAALVVIVLSPRWAAMNSSSPRSSAT
jgi:hypothetical protein